MFEGKKYPVCVWQRLYDEFEMCDDKLVHYVRLFKYAELYMPSTLPNFNLIYNTRQNAHLVEELLESGDIRMRHLVSRISRLNHMQHVFNFGKENWNSLSTSQINSVSENSIAWGITLTAIETHKLPDFQSLITLC